MHGWNGTDENTGAKCQVGVYIYQIKVTSNDGETQQFEGRVSLIE